MPLFAGMVTDAEAPRMPLSVIWSAVKVAGVAPNRAVADERMAAAPVEMTVLPV